MADPVVIHRRLLIAERAANTNPTLLDGELMLDRSIEGGHYLKVGKPGDATTFDSSDLLVYSNPEKYRPATEDTTTEDTTFTDIKAAIAGGTASTLYPIGDQVVVTYTDPNDGNEYELPWDIVSYRTVYTQDNVAHQAMILQAHYAIPTTGLRFDEPEPSNSDSDRKNHGSNRWRDSAIRQWLNSDAAANAGWWTAQTSTDAAPTSPTGWVDWPGFLKCLPESMASFLQPVKVQTATANVDSNVVDTTYDKVWLPSKEELYSVVDTTNTSVSISGVEGPYWEYWKTRMGTSSPAADNNSSTNSKRITYAINNPSSDSNVWLRSAYRSISRYVWLLFTGGILVGATNALNTYRAAPACAIF